MNTLTQFFTYQARSLADAIQIVRDELGPDASVLHTREVGSPLARFLCGPMIEVTASNKVQAPSRLPTSVTRHIPAAEMHDYRDRMRENLSLAADEETSLVEQLSMRRRAA
jgi:flagellar biosynthesis GTPase FlhF